MSKKRRYFHRTSRTAADAILHEGFQDGEGWYGFEVMLSGVWLSSVPLDCNEGADGDTLLAVTLTTARARRYDVVEADKPFSEYLVPARVLNRCGRTRLVSEAEEERLERRLLKRTQKRLRAWWRGEMRHVRLGSTSLLRES